MSLKKKNQQNAVFFIAQKGKNLYGGNMKFIAEEIIRQKMPCKICWYLSRTYKKKNLLTQDNNYGFPKEINVIVGKFGFIKQFYKSKVVACDYRLPDFFINLGFKRKNKKQFIFNTWHGSLGIKTLNDEKYAADTEYRKKMKKIRGTMNHFLNCMISNCEWESNIYRKDLHFIGDIKVLGHPRDDIFFLPQKKNEEIRKKVFTKLKIPANSKLILVAPTFRNNDKEHKIANEVLSKYDFKEIEQSFEKMFGCKCVITIRLHPERKKEKIYLPNWLADATSYPDVQELLVAADAMITDYSSCIFDFLFTKKPGFIFAPDRKHYEMTRELYFPLEESPFPVAEDNETLCKNIINFDNNLYQKRVEEFLKSRNVVDDGHASERVVELIKEHLK